MIVTASYLGLASVDVSTQKLGISKFFVMFEDDLYIPWL